MAAIVTKLSRIKDALAANDGIGALRIAAKFPDLGAHKETITRGWAAHQNPEFYAEIGMDAPKLVEAAIAAIRERYDI